VIALTTGSRSVLANRTEAFLGSKSVLDLHVESRLLNCLLETKVGKLQTQVFLQLWQTEPLNELALEIDVSLLTGPSSFAQFQQRVRVLTDCFAFRLHTMSELLTRTGGLVGETEVTQQLSTQCSKRLGRIGLVKVLDLVSSATIEGCFQMFQLVKVGSHH